MLDKSQIIHTIKLCAEGDRRAQKLIYESYYNRYYTLSLRYMGNGMLASETVNFAFYKIFSNMDQLKDPNMLEGWMKRICINVCLDEIKKNKERNIVEIQDAKESAFKVVEEESNLDLEDLLKMVAKLPSQMRSVFNLFVIDGYSHNEISEMLAISIGTCKFHLHEAKAKLKTMILLENSIITK